MAKKNAHHREVNLTREAFNHVNPGDDVIDTPANLGGQAGAIQQALSSVDQPASDLIEATATPEQQIELIQQAMSTFDPSAADAVGILSTLVSQITQTFVALFQPVTAVNATGDREIDSLLAGVKWGGPVGTGATITYSFAEANAVWVDRYGSNAPTQNFRPFSKEAREAVVDALKTWARAADLNFVPVVETVGQVGMLRFGMSDISAAGEAAFPGNQPINGDIWINNPSFPTPASVLPGNSGFALLLHEIGHALGLKHPHDSGGTQVTTTDEWQADTVMSYHLVPVDADPNLLTGSLLPEPSTPMPWDVKAIQHLYGADTTLTVGDNTYKPITAVGQAVFMTIADSGGIDTLDASNAITRVRIDLTPGEGSEIGPPVTWTGALNDGTSFETVFIADNTVIENAIGSYGHDEIVGNDVANILNGGVGVGQDNLYGRNGNDTLIGAWGHDFLFPGVGSNKVDGGGDTDSVVYVDLPVTGTTGVEVDLVTDTAQHGNDIDQLISIENVWGTHSKDSLRGNSADNLLVGFSGDDILDGCAGQDRLIGNLGADAFRFHDGDTGLGILDIIVDFNPDSGDRIDLSDVDADITVDGNQEFAWIGSADFTAPGQLQYVPTATGAIIYGNVDQEGLPDFGIDARGYLTPPKAADFVL